MPQTTPRPPSRRRFLKSAAALSAPWLLCPNARGANDRLALGCLGTGGRGTAVMRGFLGAKGVQVVAVCDVQQARREAAKRIAGGKGVLSTSDFREALALEDVDAVLIAPQDHWHGVMAVRAAAAGKHIYCEKPLGVAVTESQAIRAAVRRYGRVFQTGTQQRSSRTFRHACELALNGYLGKLHTLKVAAPGPQYQRKHRGSLAPQPVPAGLDWNGYVGPAPMKPYNPGHMAWPDWYLIWDYCAGFIVNWGVHHLDIAHWGCPAIGREPFELECKGTYRNDGFCDNISGWRGEFRFESGLRLSYSDTGHPHAQGCRFEGDAGWVHVNRRGISASPESLVKVALKPGETRLHESTHHQADFVAAVRANRDPVSPVEAGHVASTLGLVAEIAARTGRTLKWDWGKERFDDERANRQLSRALRSPWTL
ncbi:Gfo/Idh/MocA family oxidoreductase [bacterium]|nr:Gfo/Idh/MocA family oxidoreductase [bacterium]